MTRLNEEIVSMHQVAVTRGNHTIINIDKLVLRRGELLAVIGPNGAGKSTLLQTINLLLDYQGQIQLFGEDVKSANKTLLRRRSSMVFQDMLLLRDSVFNNIAMSLKFRSMNQKEIKQRVQKVISDFRCEDLSLRAAYTLSGGEAQRVCIARALVTDPELLLLDEPFASLDAAARAEMIEELRQLAKLRGITVILVSHHFSDVLQFADRAVIIRNGQIEQDDNPEALMRRPINQQIARLVGMDNIIPCSIEQSQEAYFIVLTSKIKFLYPGKVDTKSEVCCLPGDAFSLYSQDCLLTGHNQAAVIEGVVKRVTPGVGSYVLLVQSENLTLRVRLSRNQIQESIFPERNIKLTFNISEAHLI